MVFWIGAVLIALAVAAFTGIRLVKRTANPAWPSAIGFVVAIIAAFGAAAQATVASLEAPNQVAGAAVAGAARTPAPAGADDAESFDALVARLESGLAENPNDPARWALLGRSYVALGKLDDAVKAFKSAVDQTDPPEVDLLGEYAETLVAAAKGRVAGLPEAQFAKILALNPGDPRALYYLALARSDKGDLDGARAELAALLANAPPDAPWRATVFERLQELSPKDKPMAPATTSSTGDAAAPAPGPTAEQVKAAQDMSPEDRQVMIRGMVDGLAAKMAENPNDFPGWLRLANAQMVLREPSNAADSLAQALKLQPANVGLLIQFAEVRIAADRGKVGPEAEQALNRAIQRQPGNPQALWRLGQAAAVRGETEKARAMWTEILPKLLEEDPLKADVRAALVSVRKGVESSE